MEAQNLNITDGPWPDGTASRRIGRVRRSWLVATVMALLLLAAIGFTLWSGKAWQEEQALNTAACAGQTPSEDGKGATHADPVPEANGHREKDAGLDLFRVPSWQELREQLCQILSREFWE